MATRRSLSRGSLPPLAGAAAAVVAVLAVTAVVEGGHTRDPNSPIPPNFYSTLNTSYTLVLEVTNLIKNETYYVVEVHERRLYHDAMVDTVGVSITANGSTLTYQYYPELDIMIEEKDGRCGEMGEEINFAWGWLDKVPSHGSRSFGPSSILRLISFLKPDYIENTLPINDIDVEVWQATVEDHAVVTYYFSKPPWSMPEGPMYGNEMTSLPVLIEVHLPDGGEHTLYTFVEFKPYVTFHNILEPPRGMSCEGIAGILTHDPVPMIPKHYSLAQEIILNSVIDGRDFGNQHMDKVQMTYAEEISLVSLLVSLPYDNKYSTSYAVKIIHDFNTGIQYTMFKEFGNCSKDPIPPFTFDEHFGGFLGNGDTLLSSNGMFHLDDKFAFVGERESRDILGELWTSTRLGDIPDPSTGGMQNFEKAVLEYYFSQGLERNPAGSFKETDLPFRGDLFIYNASNPNQILRTLTTNFYDFRELNLFSPDEFSVESCYEKYDDNWSYIDIFFPISRGNQVVAASEEQTRFKHEVMAKLIEIGRLSPVRIASIDVNTGISGLLPNTSNVDTIVAKVKLLERGPYIFSYRQPPDELQPQPGKNEKLVPNIRRRDDCATICSTSTDRTCLSFHHCDDNCYLSSTTGTDGDALGVEGCEHWVYDLQNRTVPDYPSELVFKSLFEAIKKGDFHFNVPFRNNTSGVGFEAKMSLHYRTPDPFDPVRMQFTLEAAMTTVVHPNNTIRVADLTECLLLCVGWVRYRCETVVHQTEEGLCLLVEAHYQDLPKTELTPHSHSYVHGRSYLVDYSPVLGGVALNTSGPSYYPVEHLEVCARYCSQETSIACQSFEFCPSNQMCHLHAEHFLDAVENGNYITGTACIHFSTKIEASFTKYEDQGLQPSQHTLVAHLSSPSSCAKMCMQETDQVCQSYDFCSVCDKNNAEVCGQENLLDIGLCFLGYHHLGEPGLTLTKGKACDHYDRDTFGDLDYPSWVSRQRKSDKPYTPGDMTGLAFGMIFLGILLAVVFLVAITWARPSTMPKDLELSFQRLKTSGESNI